jgi:hypothetical protein
MLSSSNVSFVIKLFHIKTLKNTDPTGHEVEHFGREHLGSKMETPIAPPSVHRTGVLFWKHAFRKFQPAGGWVFQNWMGGNDPELRSGTQDYPSRPQAISAGRKGIAETVFLVGFCKLASSAVNARRELKSHDPVSECPVFLPAPDILQCFFADGSKTITPNSLFSPQYITGKGVHQSHARAYRPVP